MTQARETVKLMPDDAVSRHLYGYTLALHGRLKEAEREFTRALELNPSLAVAREHLGWIREGR
jgi:Flp pilus assembly protein TadD